MLVSFNFALNSANEQLLPIADKATCANLHRGVGRGAYRWTGSSGVSSSGNCDFKMMTREEEVEVEENKGRRPKVDPGCKRHPQVRAKNFLVEKTLVLSFILSLFFLSLAFAHVLTTVLPPHAPDPQVRTKKWLCFLQPLTPASSSMHDFVCVHSLHSAHSLHCTLCTVQFSVLFPLSPLSFLFLTLPHHWSMPVYMDEVMQL